MSDRFNRLEDDVDAARLQSVRVTGGTGNIFTKGWLASAKLRSLVEIILARPIRGQDFNFSFNVIFLSTTDVNYVGHEVDSRPALQDVDQHV